MEQPGRTLLAKIWDQHVIAHLGDDTDLLHVDRHLLHDLGGSRGLLDLKRRNLPVHNPELTFATPDHAISTARGTGRHQPGRAGTARWPADRNLSRWHRDVRYRRARSGHRPCHRTRTRPEPSRLPDRVRRQSHLHAWRARRAGLRHRIERTHACTGDAGHHPAPAQDHAGQIRGPVAVRRDRQGPDPGADRPCRRRRRHRLCRRICRQCHPRTLARRPPHDLQPVDRTRRQNGFGGAGRQDLRLSPRPPLRAIRRDVGAGGRMRGVGCRAIPMRCSTARS